jgi:hypothetical protein
MAMLIPPSLSPQQSSDRTTRAEKCLDENQFLCRLHAAVQRSFCG